MKNYTYVFTFFYVFLKIQKRDFLRFFELLHTFTRTLTGFDSAMVSSSGRFKRARRQAVPTVV